MTAESPEPPGKVTDLVLIAPSGRRYRFRRLSGRERLGVFAATCARALLIVSGMLWAVYGRWLWRIIAGMFQ
jgi:hypothetical protein